MGFLDKLLDLIGMGEPPEIKEAKARMKSDAAADPLRANVFGLLAISYDVDPAYLRGHAETAINDWYGVRTAADIDKMQFGTKTHEGYNLYRRIFLTRAGFGAGVLDEAGSWQRAIALVKQAQQKFGSWKEYADSYLAGHMEYRASQGDSKEQLAGYTANIKQRIQQLSSGVWATTPWR